MQAFGHFFCIHIFFFCDILQKFPKSCVNEKLSIVKNVIPFPLYVGSKSGKFIKCAIFLIFICICQKLFVILQRNLECSMRTRTNFVNQMFNFTPPMLRMAA